MMEMDKSRVGCSTDPTQLFQDITAGNSKDANVVMVTGDDPLLDENADKQRSESDNDDDEEQVDQVTESLGFLANSKQNQPTRPLKRQSSVVCEDPDSTDGVFDLNELHGLLPESRPTSGNVNSTQPQKIFIDSALHQDTNTNLPCNVGQKLIKSVHSVLDICDGKRWYLIKNRILYDEKNLLLYLLFWSDEKDHTVDIKHHSKSCLTKVAVKHTDTLHFQIMASCKNGEYYLNKLIKIIKSFKANYFGWDTCKIFQYRVGSGPDKIPNTYIDINYCVQAESMEPQEVYDRFVNRGQHADIESAEKEHWKGKAVGQWASRPINIYQGDYKTSARTAVHAGGVYHEKATDGITYVGTT